MLNEGAQSPMTEASELLRSRRGFLKLAGLGVATVGAGGLLAACGSGASKASSGLSSNGALTRSTRFRIASAPIDNYFLDTVALNQGLYDKYHLEVGKPLYPSSGVQGMQLLAAGAADGMLQDMMLVLAGFASAQQGKRPQIIGMGVPENTYAIVAGKGGSWPGTDASFQERMAALKGKRVGVPAVGSGADQQLRLALQEAGMKYGDVTHLGVGQFSAGMAQLKAGRLDAYMCQTYATTRLMAAATGGSVYLELADPSVPDVLSKQQVDAYIVGEEFLAKSQNVAKAWLSANTAAKDWVLANKTAAADLLNKQDLGGNAAPIATEYIEHYTSVVVPKIQPDWKATRTGVELMIQIGTTLGVVKQGQVTYEDLVPEFARA